MHIILIQYLLWFLLFVDLLELSSLCLGEGTQISHRFLISSCENTQQKFVCQEKNFVEYSEAIALSLSTQSKNDTSYNYIYTYFNVIFLFYLFIFFNQKIGFVFRFCVRKLLSLRIRNGWR